jgi:Ras-related protein Rab-5C
MFGWVWVRIGASYTPKTVTVESVTVRLQIWDIGGQEKYRAMTPMYFHSARVGVVVYSVTDRDSFVAADEWITSLKENAESDVLIYLVGNKVDMESERAVSPEEGNAKAVEYNAEFMEASAKTGFGVHDLFAAIPRAYLERCEMRTTPRIEQAKQLSSGSDDDQKSCC